jgi:putative two-component system response regulator
MINSYATILAVDDNLNNLNVLSDLLDSEDFEMLFATDGESALKRAQYAAPDLILLDIMMPGMDGFETARRLKTIDITQKIPIIFLTALSDEDHITKAFELGGVDYITKPFNGKEVISRINTHLTLKNLIDHLDELVRKKTIELEQLNVGFVVALEKANYYNDKSTGNHIKRVSHYSRILAEGLGLPEEICTQIFRYASLHDIGKVGIPDSILKKPGRLSREEFDILKRHSQIGFKMIDSPAVVDVAKNIVRYHHERYDGTGYPDQLKGEKIPIEARIVTLADVYDALRTERVYKDAFSEQEADKIISELSGSLFDPKLVTIYQENKQAFEDIHDRFTE